MSLNFIWRALNKRIGNMKLSVKQNLKQKQCANSSEMRKINLRAELFKNQTHKILDKLQI